MSRRGGAGTRRRRLVAAACTAGAVVVADQVTKDLALEHLARGPLHLLGPLSLSLAFNSGVAFSLFRGLTLPVILVGLGLVVLLVWALRGAPSLPVALGLGLVLGGACSNLGDRIFRGRGGAVVDFVHLGFWPTFNLADAAIVCGCVVLGVALLRSPRQRAGREQQGEGERR